MCECCDPKSDRQEQLLAVKGAPTQSDAASDAAVCECCGGAGCTCGCDCCG